MSWQIENAFKKVFGVFKRFKEQKGKIWDNEIEALKLLKSKHQSVFPLLKSESITILIFSYVDVYSKSVDLLKRLNSYGYDIYALRLHIYKPKFELYLKSDSMCNSIKAFNEEEVFT